MKEVWNQEMILKSLQCYTLLIYMYLLTVSDQTNWEWKEMDFNSLVDLKS